MNSPKARARSEPRSRPWSKGLKSGNAALVTAAAEEMHANASDVGGNQLTVTAALTTLTV